MRKLIIPLSVFVFLLGLFVFIFSHFAVSKKDISFFVHGGRGLSGIAYDLERQDVISSGFVFKVYSKILGLTNDCDVIYEGEYVIKEGESFVSIIKNICNGKVVLKQITIPEGLETREVVELLNNNNDLSGEKIIATKEAIIMPDTYTFDSKFDRQKLFQKMKSNLTDYINKFWDERIRNDFIQTKQELLILASIVEKEAKTDEERPIIASVYLNRLAKGMRLEACPTAIYETTKGQYKFNRTLTIKDTQKKGDYNTYRKKGLPIAPICNPGVNSILAVLYPAETKYLYFVAKADLSGHLFAETYNEHLKNIKAIKEEKRARGQQK